MRPRQPVRGPHTRVLLIEAGGADTKREIRIPLAWLKLFKSEVDWDYTTTPQAGLGGRRVYWPRGKTLGGCSSTNAMIAIPGHRADYDGWADLGNEGWSFDELAPVFERVSDALAVEELRDPNALTHACIEGRCRLAFHGQESWGRRISKAFARHPSPNVVVGAGQPPTPICVPRCGAQT